MWRDQIVSINNARVLLKFQIFISFCARIITDYVFHTFENVKMKPKLVEEYPQLPPIQKSVLDTVQFLKQIFCIQGYLLSLFNKFGF